MKKHLLVSALAATLVLAGCNNTAKNQTKETSTTITEQSSEVQKVGYSLGFDMGQNLKEGADDMDLEAFYTGLKDAYANKDGALTREQMEGVMRTYLERKQAEMSKKTEEKAAANKTAGAAFLAENAKKEGVITTASGLQYKVIKEGTGESPKATDTVTVNYEGKLIDGTVFDSSYERNEPISFPLNQVIAGWTEGLQLMKPGGQYELYIPSDLAYGETGNPSIEPNSVLIFKIELLDEAAAKAAQEKAKAQQEEQMKQMLAQIEAQQSAQTTEAPAQKPAQPAQ